MIEIQFDALNHNHIHKIIMQSRIIPEQLQKRLSKLSNKQVSRMICSKIQGDLDVIKFYNQLEDEDLQVEISIIVSEEASKSQLHFQIPKEMREIQISRISMKNISLQASKAQEKLKASQQGSVQYYIDKQLQFVEKYQKFNKLLTPSFIKQFQIIYKEFQNFPVIAKQDILEQVQRIQEYSVQKAFLRELRIVDSSLFHSSQGKHRLRVTQVLAIYCFLHHPQIKKLLLQILTGQGKSTTIACIAAILTMRGHVVDVITVNKNLAMRDPMQKKQFFKLMGMEATHNIPPSGQQEQSLQLCSPRKCYEIGKIVYGTPFSFQVDLLFDEYKKKGTRNKRPYQIAIIDEVDSMFVDQKENQTLLSSTYSGYAELKAALKIIWQTVLTHNILNENGKLFLLKDGINEGEVIKGEVSQFLDLIIRDIRQKFQNDIINEEKLEFINISLEEWVWSALTAAHVYKRDIHYLIEKGKIIPVDFKNTGSLQKNVEWENGLHQFLQMKHRLYVSVETMTSNFMSNIGHFCRYRFLYGLTGTLGSKESIQFLKKVYEVEIFQIPPFHESRLSIEPGFVMYDHQEWINRIVQRCSQMIRKNRAVLLICQSIRQANIIQQTIKIKNVQAKSITHIKTGEEEISDQIDCKFIIVATNLAGRGTDLKASPQLIDEGGLHVIITFVPQNLRVQKQAIGRAARNGAPGSGEIIMNLTEYSEAIKIPLLEKEKYVEIDLQNNLRYFLQQFRDRREADLMKKDYERVQNIRVRDSIFQIFCSAINQIPDYQTNSAKRNAVEEQWAMFLKRGDHLHLSNEEKVQAAKEFAHRIINESQSFYKLSHGVARGLNELINNSDTVKAKQFFKMAQDSKCTKISQIGGKILQGATIIKQNSRKKENVTAGMQVIRDALKIIGQKKDMIKGFHFRDLSTGQSIAQQLEKKEDKEIIKYKESIQKEQVDLDGQSFQIQEEEKLSLINVLDASHIKALESLEKHILAQQEKCKNLKKGQFIEIKFQKLQSLIDEMEGREDNLKEALDQMAPDIPFLPVFEVKKKVSIWKRSFVFALGVLQICIGALIVSATTGAINFGAFMIQSGIKDCIDSVFRPEVIRELKKYYTQKSIQYGMAAVFAGTQALKQIYTAGLKGFTLIKGSSMNQIMKMAMGNIQKGLSLGTLNIGSMAQNIAFKSVSRIGVEVISSKQNKINQGQVLKAVKKSEFKSLVSTGQQQQEKMQLKMQEVKQKFEKQFEEIVQSIVTQQLEQNVIPKIMKMDVDRQIIFELLHKIIVKKLKLGFDDSTRSRISGQIKEFIRKNYQNQSLASCFVKKFSIDQQIRKALSFEQKQQQIIQELSIRVQKQMCRVGQKYQKEFDQLKNMLKKEKAQIQSNLSITVAEKNRKIGCYKQKYQNAKEKEALSKSFKIILKKVMQNQNFLTEVIDSEAISQRRNNQQNYDNLHPYLKEALQNLQNSKLSEQDLKSKIQLAIFNIFNGIPIKALVEAFDSTSNSASRLKQLQSKLYEKMRKQE